MKIVFFGDSITQGTYGTSYVDKLAGMLRGHHFINEGIGGDTSLNLLRRVENSLFAHEPEGVVLMVGINDALAYAEPGVRSYYRLVKRVPQGQLSPISFRENIRTLLMKFIAADLRTWLVLQPIEYRPALVAALRQMNDYAAEVAGELRIPTLDLMAKLIPAQIPERPPMKVFDMRSLEIALTGSHYERFRQERGYTYTFDGIHLTDSGAQRFAEEIAPFLRNNGLS
jgi:lysophospholipase L1-like esterase